MYTLMLGERDQEDLKNASPREDSKDNAKNDSIIAKT